MYNCLVLLKFGSNSNSALYFGGLLICTKIPNINPITPAVPIFKAFFFKKIKIEIKNSNIHLKRLPINLNKFEFYQVRRKISYPMSQHLVL